MMQTVDRMKEIAVMSVEEYLGEKYPGIEVEFESEVDENSVTTEYLMISDHHVMGFRIPVKTLFDKYRNGEDIEKYLKEKLGGFLKEYEIVKEAYAFFDHVKEDFSIAKEYLVPYVFDAEIRATLLENHPYRRIGDIALECHLLYERDGLGMQMSINHDTIQKWGITEDELVELLFARHQENGYLAGANEMEEDRNRLPEQLMMGKCPCQVAGYDHIEGIVWKVRIFSIHAVEFCGGMLLCGKLSGMENHVLCQVYPNRFMSLG